MLKIDTNGVVKFSRGDDVKFPLFLNQGTRMDPIRYEFKEPSLVIDINNPNLSISYDLDVWEEKVEEAGEYDFVYVESKLAGEDSSWQLEGQDVSLEEYGIVVEGNPINEDVLTVIYDAGDGCEVYFFLFEPNDDKPFFKKTFTSKKDLWKGKLEDEEAVGDMKITLLHDDPLLYPRCNIKTLGDVPEGK